MKHYGNHVAKKHVNQDVKSEKQKQKQIKDFTKSDLKHTERESVCFLHANRRKLC